MEILDRIPLEIKTEQIMERLHLGNDKKYMDIVQEFMDQIMPVICPKAMYDVKFVEHIDKDSVKIGEVKFTSRILRVNLDKVGKAFPYIVTSGMEAENVDVPDSDLMGKFIVDAIKETALGIASNYLTEYIKNKYKIENMSSMNPGSLEDWPIYEQKPLFSIFGNVEELIGVRLSDSFLMFPIKSVSGIYFPTESSFASCQICPREKCPNRRAKYDPELKEKYMSE